ncbi:MAG: LD-carboxypeptidase [Clostridia bacterium]
MKYAKFLNKEDLIGVCALSEGFSLDNYYKLDLATSNIKKIGYNVIISDIAKNNIKGRSADKITRSNNFFDMYKNDKIKCLINAKGGSFLFECLPYIKFDEICNLTPKWVQGYSDTTTILFTLTTICDIATIYSENFSGLALNNIHKSFVNNFDILSGKNITQNSFEYYEENDIDDTTLNLNEHNLTSKVCVKSLFNEKQINIKGRLIGGCLDVLLNIVGTRFDNVNNFLEKYKSDGFIWYLESYNIDTASITIALLQLKEAGWFKYIKGIVFGRPYVSDIEYNISYKEALYDALKDFNIPVIYDADIGHKFPQFTLINGSIANIKYIDNKISIVQELI